MVEPHYKELCATLQEQNRKLLEELKKLLALWDAVGDCTKDEEIQDFIVNNFEEVDSAREVIAEAEGKQL